MIHLYAPDIGGINDDIQSDKTILDFKNGEQLEDFYIRILRL